MGPYVVVEHGDRHQTAAWAAQHFADGGGAGIAAADHCHTESEALRPPLPGKETGVEPDQSHAGGGKHAAHHDDERRDQLDMNRVTDGPEGDEDAERRRHRQEELAGLVGTRMAPHPPIESVETVAEDRHDNGESEELDEVEPVARWGGISEIGHLGKAVADHDRDSIEDDEEDARTDAAGRRRYPADVRPRVVAIAKSHDRVRFCTRRWSIRESHLPAPLMLLPLSVEAWAVAARCPSLPNRYGCCCSTQCAPARLRTYILPLIRGTVLSWRTLPCQSGYGIPKFGDHGIALSGSNPTAREISEYSSLNGTSDEVAEGPFGPIPTHGEPSCGPQVD